MRNAARRFVLFGVLASMLFAGVSCKQVTEDRPKLVVMIVIDQFRYDFLERFKGLFGSGGFRRLMDQGAFMQNANYIYMPTYTAPGHAAIFTGSDPEYDGIVGNNWYDRETGRDRVMVSDDKAKLVTSLGVMPSTSSTQPASPRILIGATIGDQIRLSNEFKSKVIAVSMKDRAAVLPGGKDANGAYWFDPTTGTFLTSDYYMSELPKWLLEFNNKREPDSFYGKVWDRSLPAEAYGLSQSSNTTVSSPIGRTFPHKITGGADYPGEAFNKAFLYSPFASEYLADFAKAAIEGEALGTDDYPDLLAISFSTTDYVGHAYGPDSEEIEDTYVRLDRTLADLFDYIDSKVGLSNTVIVMTGDHGVSPVPQFLSINNMDAGTIDPAVCKDFVSRALAGKFGEGDWVLDLVNDQIYLNKDLLAQKNVDEQEAERIAADALRTVSGITQVFTRAQILNGEMPSGVISQRVSNGFNASRSGDVWLITKPFYFLGEGGAATTHGSPYNYDTHVPVLFLGKGIRPGNYETECSPSDIAPTVAALLHIEPPPNRVGRVLVEALEQQ